MIRVGGARSAVSSTQAASEANAVVSASILSLKMMFNPTRCSPYRSPDDKSTQFDLRPRVIQVQNDGGRVKSVR